MGPQIDNFCVTELVTECVTLGCWRGWGGWNGMSPDQSMVQRGSVQCYSLLGTSGLSPPGIGPERVRVSQCVPREQGGAAIRIRRAFAQGVSDHLHCVFFQELVAISSTPSSHLCSSFQQSTIFSNPVSFCYNDSDFLHIV